ncbi:hypothetical protein OG435_09185 [Streptomyces sp. NBC_01264]|nr:hypothetical protein [Streptomyces sp. NBC_01264]
MSSTKRLFSAGDLHSGLNSQLHRVPDAVAKWDEDLFLATPEPDIVDLVLREFTIETPVCNGTKSLLSQSRSRTSLLVSSERRSRSDRES